MVLTRKCSFGSRGWCILPFLCMVLYGKERQASSHLNPRERASEAILKLFVIQIGPCYNLSISSYSVSYTIPSYHFFIAPLANASLTFNMAGQTSAFLEGSAPGEGAIGRQERAGADAGVGQFPVWIWELMVHGEPFSLSKRGRSMGLSNLIQLGHQDLHLEGLLLHLKEVESLQRPQQRR
ncbi:hypothetical protein BJ878DRAFT_191343 [Calycina marina]|uniref:Uncharacterized protein n=1 Tax=Calycina marina TaxID=1763456 RepID=A0A9P7Z9J6_9HELO|nr:hypothetical protein BJ878DRAFT_191343 [Calycina marina]